MKLNIDELIPPEIVIDPSVILSLKESIRTHGLLHPITVQQMNGKYQIIAGIKRYLAVKELGQTEIEVQVRDGLTESSAAELHIHENLRRANLTWYEQAELVSDLHLIRQKKFGKPVFEKGGGPKGGKKSGWSMRDTAKELGRALGAISEDIQIARLIRMDPSLKNIKDKATALKIAKKYVKRATQEESSSAIPIIRVDQVLCGSSAELLPKYPKEIFDCCITDPPWLKFIDKSLTRDDETVPVFEQIWRVMKQDSFLYLFCGVDDFLFYRDHLATIKFKVQQHPLLWIKRNAISMGSRNWEYWRDYELILVAVKGDPALLITNVSAIFDYPIIHPSKLIHPNEKPIAMIEALISQCTYDYATILDPFAGSGVVGHAAKNLQRHYFMIERDMKYFKQIEERMK